MLTRNKRSKRITLSSHPQDFSDDVNRILSLYNPNMASNEIPDVSTDQDNSKSDNGNNDISVQNVPSIDSSCPTPLNVSQMWDNADLRPNPRVGDEFWHAGGRASSLHS